MKAVLRQVDEEELARRRRLGLDRRDEMWEGVLHMSPAPSDEHQRILDELIAFLVPLLRKRGRGTLRSGVNVFNPASPTQDYRIPDLSFVARGRESIMQPQGIVGGPDAVIEIRSPDDETFEKFPFYASLGVREVVVIDRNTRKPEVYRLAGPQYLAIAADRDGGVVSEALRVRFRRSDAGLVVEDLDDPSVRVEF